MFFKRHLTYTKYFLFPSGILLGFFLFWIIQRDNPEPEIYVGKICLIIDDFGNSLNEEIIGFLNLGHNITIAIIPGHQYTRETAVRASENGIETMIHMPMESWEGIDPDETRYSLYQGLNQEEFNNRIDMAFDEIPNAIGMNNHQGSKSTEDPQQMKMLARILKKRDLLFVDSFTSPDSRALVTMKKMGVKTGLRQLFLDNEEDETSIRNQLDSLMVIAKDRGSVIGIGHCKPITLKVLREALPEIEKNGFKLVPVSEIVN